ncbi:MAG TPA: sensor histidine kinase [Frankiaceae bacterium]|nr:sensor histidine kinase [Frankiaceae bacterium]
MRVPRRPVRSCRAASAPDAADIAVVVGFLIVAEVELAAGSTPVFSGSAPHALQAILVALPVLPLLVRRRRPLEALAGVSCLLLAGPALADSSVLFWGGLFPLLLAVFSLARFAAGRTAVIGLIWPVLALGLLPLFVSGFDVPGDYVFSGVLTAASWLTGRGIRRWQTVSTRLSVALEELRTAQKAQAAAAVGEERTRIARELHDIIAHGLSVMVLQSGAARLDLRTDPDRAEEALTTVEQTGRRSLTEMRRLLEVLRTDEQAGRAPQPGLADLESLILHTRRAGLDVSSALEGAPVPLPASQDLSAYRVVQEALTNALKHGDGSASLRLRYTGTCLEIRMQNPVDPHPSETAGPGHGLIGMRERAALFGGTVRAGASPDGVYELSVALPVEASR